MRDSGAEVNGWASACHALDSIYEYSSLTCVPPITPASHPHLDGSSRKQRLLMEGKDNISDVTIHVGGQPKPMRMRHKWVSAPAFEPFVLIVSE